jgi:hypothetical protein
MRRQEKMGNVLQSTDATFMLFFNGGCYFSLGQKIAIVWTLPSDYYVDADDIKSPTFKCRNTRVGFFLRRAGTSQTTIYPYYQLPMAAPIYNPHIA